MQSRAQEVQIEAAFSLAHIYIAGENYDKAIEFLTAILNRFPDLARVRLDLAFAYFLNQDYDDARFHFEMVKGGNKIPPGVLENVDSFLAAIRRQKSWSVSAGFSIIPDSNINQSSGVTEECIDTIFGILCRDLEDQASGVGVGFNLTANYYLKLSKNFGIRNTLGVYLTEHSDSDYNDYIVYAASGPRYVYSSGEISLQPTYIKRLIGGDSYSDSYGLRTDVQHDFGRLLLGAGVSAIKNTYKDEFVSEALKGEEYRFYLRPRVILSSQSFVQAGLEFTHDRTNTKQFGSDTLRYSLGAYYFFKYGFSLLVEASLSNAAYHADQYYVTKDQRFNSTRRNDRIYGFSAELSSNIWEHKGIRPTIQYYYTKRDSNIWSHDYARHRVNLMLDFTF